MRAVSKIARIFTEEFKALFSNTIAIILTIGLIVMPSIFSWFNVLACWNVFENTDRITVAVASEDTGYTSDLFPLEVNIGESVISALRANDDIDWVFTDSEDALDGASSGRYYAAVIIPEGFSQSMLTFYMGGADPAQITYYSNEKLNAIAPKITDRSADSVSYQVNQVFAQTLSEVGLAVAQALGQMLQDPSVSNSFMLMAQDMSLVADRMDQGAALVGTYQGLAAASESLLESSAQLVEASRGQAVQIAAIASDTAAGASQTVSALNQASHQMIASIDASIASLQSMIDQSQQTPVNPGQDGSQLPSKEEAAAQLRAQADAIGEQIASYEEILDQLQQDPEANAQAIAATQETIATLQKLQQDLYDSADALEQGQTSVDDVQGQIVQDAQAAIDALTGLRTVLDQVVLPRLDALSQEIGDLSATIGAVSTQLASSTSGLAESATRVAGGLGQVSNQLASLSTNLSESASTLRQLSQALAQAVQTQDLSALYDLVGGDISEFTSALVEPVGISRTAVFPVANFGSAMSPLYSTLALFIGGLLIMVAVKPRTPQSVRDRLASQGITLQSRHLFLGHFGIVAFLSLAQSLLMALGNLLFIQVQVVHPWLFLLAYVVIGEVFSFIVYTLVASFANLGKALSVVLLVAQVTGCGGSYPVAILPGFVQAVSPFLPATHAVNAIRSAMLGVYAGDFWVELGVLMVFVLLMLLVGLVLNKPFAKLMEWYVKQVEASKLMS